MSDDAQADESKQPSAGLTTLVQAALSTPQPSEKAEAEAQALAMARFEEIDSLTPRALSPQGSNPIGGIWARIRRLWHGGQQ